MRLLRYTRVIPADLAHMAEEITDHLFWKYQARNWRPVQVRVVVRQEVAS